MRILIAPLGMPLPTMGPAGRAISLAREAVRRGHEIGFCAALDGNLKPEALPEQTEWFPSPASAVLGLPGPIGRLLPRLMMAAGLGRKARVKSFEQVLFMGGHLKLDFFLRDVQALRLAIRRFRPDVVFSEYRFQAIVAARLENKPVAGTHSFPGRAAFASSPDLSKAVRGWLAGHGFGPLDSVLSLFEEPSPRFVCSSAELEPFPEEVVYVGPMTGHLIPPGSADRGEASGPGDAIVAYMGNGGMPVKRLAATLGEAIGEGGRQVYIAGASKQEQRGPNVHLAPRFDFSELLPRAAVFVNHGGQNSIMDGLLAGVPQVMVPGTVFERDYNAESVERLGAGRKLSMDGLTPQTMARAIEDLSGSEARAKARQTGERLAALGGAAKVLEVLESRFSR